jgi:hypothetical protein
VNLFRDQQIALIADLLAGRRTEPLPHDIIARFTEPWLSYYKEIIDLIDEGHQPTGFGKYNTGLGHEFEKFYFYHHQNDDTHSQNLSILIDVARNPGPDAYPPASKVLATLPDVKWMWPSWVPRSLVTILAASPGTGKSYFALDIARRICQGSEFPDGSPIEQSANVLFVDAENRPGLLKPRLSVWAPPELLDRFYLMLANAETWGINLDGPDQIRFLDMMWKIKPALVIVDSFGAATEKGENSKEDVRRVLAFFNQLVTEFDCSMFIIHHLRKGLGSQSSFIPMGLDDVRGSSHLGAMAAVVIGLQWVPTGANPDPNGPRRLWLLKSNISPKPEPLGVLLQEHPADKQVAQVLYVDAPLPYKAPTKRQECREWLLDLLADSEKPMRPSDIVEQAKKAGYTRRIVYYARDELKEQIVSTAKKNDPTTRWTLAS